VSSDIGAISPGLWQLVQLLKKIGAMSRLNVGTAAAGDWASAPAVAAITKAQNVPMARIGRVMSLLG